MKGLFVIGTDTGVGKTLVSGLLMAGAAAQVRYWKPVQTGDDDDTATVRSLAGLPAERCVDLGHRLAAPASPHHAAQLEGREVTLEPLLELAARHDSPQTRWVVEGAGGLCVPYSPTLLQIELVRRLGLPVLLVASTRLGTINHTLLTLRALQSEGLDAMGIVLCGQSDAGARSGIAAHAQVPVLASIPDLSEDLEAGTERAFASRLLIGTLGERAGARVLPAVQFWGRILLACPAIAAALGSTSPDRSQP